MEGPGTNQLSRQVSVQTHAPERHTHTHAHTRNRVPTLSEPHERLKSIHLSHSHSQTHTICNINSTWFIMACSEGISRRNRRKRWRDEVNIEGIMIGESIRRGKTHVREKRGDLKRERRNEREMWKETELLLVSGVRLNGKRDDKGDMERERWVEGGRVRDLCAFSLFSVVW